MNALRQTWLVAKRELRERSRSRAFAVSLGIMVVTVAAMIVLPTVLLGSGRTADVGLAGSQPKDLPATVQTQAAAVGVIARLHRYEDRAAGEDAVRRGEVDVLVVEGDRLEWPRSSDEKLKAIVTGAIQVVAISDRAAAAGISPGELSELVAPVDVTNVELSAVAGRTQGDQTATVVMTGLLLAVMSIYGSLVLTGVVEEKTSRVVEVLLSRMPPRSLLAGKIVGIGLLGLGQVVLTAAAAFVAVTAVDSLDVPAIRATVLVWLVVWFVLGYALYAVLFGALGALASRPEDAQATVAPTSVVMIASYFAAFFLIDQPDSAGARIVSLFPTTAPLAMPGRIAMGSPAWWEPILAVLITAGAIAALIRLGGRLYATAVLHSGPTLSLRDAWQRASAAGQAARQIDTNARRGRALLWRMIGSLSSRGTSGRRLNDMTHRVTTTILMAVGVALGVVVGVLTGDVIIGVIVGAGFIALTVNGLNLWTGHGRAASTR